MGWSGRATTFLVLAVKSAVRSGLISADDHAGNDLADGSCMRVLLSHRAPPLVLSARRAGNLAVTCAAHAAF